MAQTHWLVEETLRITSQGWSPYRWEEPCMDCANVHGRCCECSQQDVRLDAALGYPGSDWVPYGG
jgi:hypothetical protein